MLTLLRSLKVGNKMEETYTFSTALRMMRYSGKKMKSCEASGIILKVVDDDLMQYNEDYKQKWVYCQKIYADDIMGSWIEVK